MDKIRQSITKIISLCFVLVLVFMNAAPANAFSAKSTPPLDWAFEESSRGLNDAIIEKYPDLDNGDGYVTIDAAKNMTGSIKIQNIKVKSTLNGIENFVQVSELALSESQLVGEIPKNIVDLSNLTRLNLINNRLSGEIPSSIGNLTNLFSLDLTNNQLNGEIPSSIGDLKNLTSLSLSDNQLSGEIPSNIGDLTNLSSLYLADNQLNGEIPSSIGDLENLTSLSLSDNQLNGVIPSNIGDLTNLAILRLNDNQLSNEIPSSIGDLIKLIDLDLSRNQLSGEIPSSIGNLVNLNELILGSNQLSGEIPSSIGNLNNLTSLDLYDNQLSGEIPDCIGDLADVTVLVLSNNQLSGEIPSSIVNMQNLSALYLNDNQFTSVSDDLINFLNQIYTSLTNQTTTLNLTEKGTVNNDYTINAYNVYVQFPNYGTNFKYSLETPNGNVISINPMIIGDELVVSGTDLTQRGHYTLIATGSEGLFDGSVYTTHFMINEAKILNPDIPNKGGTELPQTGVSLSYAWLLVFVGFVLMCTKRSSTRRD